jgi:phospholipase C
MKSSIPTLALALAVANVSTLPMAHATGVESFPADIRAARATQGDLSTLHPAQANPIRHVLIIVQENRTPDNLFHGLPGADIATEGVDSRGNHITLRPQPLVNDYDLGHTHADFVNQYDGGNMDGADKVQARCADPNDPTCPPNHPQFKYVDPDDVAPYFQMAQTYVFGDRMFQSNQGPSYPAHQFLISGTSTPSAGGDYDDDLASENPKGPSYPTGCVKAPPGQRVAIIDPQGVEQVDGVYPCFEHPTVIDLLEQAEHGGHTWSYYTANLAGIWTAPNSIQHIRTGSGWKHVKRPASRVLADIAGGTLSDVSWVTPTVAESDHPRTNDGTGPSWVASIVNAIGTSDYWKDTAIFIVWDDWGGWYDHVQPPIYSSYGAGFRVPLIVVSPYAKAGYVSHVTHTFGSLLRFIEVTYGLPSLSYEDARSDDMADCFDFKQPPVPFKPIKAAHDAAFFLQREQDGVSAEPDID